MKFPTKNIKKAINKFRFFGGLCLVIACLGSSTIRAQTASYVLGVESLAVGPASGTNSVILAVSPTNTAWTATPNAPWLHLDSTNESGLGSGVVVFTFDANPAGPRIGTLTVGDQTLSITQAGSNYVQIASMATLVSGLINNPIGVALDGAGNVYFSQNGTGTVKKWSANSGTVTTLISSGLLGPTGVAVDNIGNVYVASGNNGAIEELSITNDTLTTLKSGLFSLFGLALDSTGDVFVTEPSKNSAVKWSAATRTSAPLSIAGLSSPEGIAVDVAGNVYIANTAGTVYELSPENILTTLVNQPGLTLYGLAVDGSGNTYLAANSGQILERSYLNTNLATVVSIGLYESQGVAVNPSGDIFIADSGNGAIKELPRAFIDRTSKLEGLDSGSDSLPAVVSATSNLLTSLPPTSDSAWLTITGITNGIVTFAFTSSDTNRTGHINLLGQAISITQGDPAFALGTQFLVESSGEGSDSVVLAADSGPYPWTATNNNSWLHISPGFQSGNSATNVIFSFDANPGTTRTGTLTIAGQTLTVTQAGSTYVPAGTLTTLVPEPAFDIAVNTNGNVYFLDGEDSIKQWSPVTDKVTTLISTRPNGFDKLVSDGMGNLYAENSGPIGFPAIDEWVRNSNALITLPINVILATSLAVDYIGDIYFLRGSVVGSWTASSGATTGVPVPSLNVAGVAVDRAGNVYAGTGPTFKSPGFTATTNWAPAVAVALTTLATAASNRWKLTVDGSGNIYSSTSIDQSNQYFAYEWSAASNIVTTLVSSGLGDAAGVTVDALGNLYFTRTSNNTIGELPRAFVDPTPKIEGLAAGNDSLPPVLPWTENLRPPFAPTSDQPWLTITDVTNGVVSFAFTATTTNRTANITLFGQTIPVTQEASLPLAPPPSLTSVQALGGGLFQVGISNVASSASVVVLTSTNMALPISDWTLVGTATNTAPAQFQFTLPGVTNDSARFFVIRSQ